MIGLGLSPTLGRPALPSVSDTFTRADSATSLGSAETGQVWTALAGTWGISAGRAYCAAVEGGGTNRSAVAVDSGASDGTVGVTLAVVASESRVLFRASDVQNGFIVQAATDRYILYRREAAVYTALGTYLAAPASGDRVEVVLSGNSIRVRINGVERIAVTSTFNLTATRHGLGMGDGGGAATARFDNFRVSR